MSILGYSASYFLPEYWANTPFYGEKIIPLLDYILSTDFTQTDKLASAFYVMEDKYKNTADLPLDAIEAIIEESGYSYVMKLLGNDEDSIRLLVYLLVLIHQLKGTKLGIEVVLSLLKKEASSLVMGTIGKPTIDSAKNVSGFTTSDYVMYNGFTVDDRPFELDLQFRTPATITSEQCIVSTGHYGFYVGINSNKNLVLCLGSNRTSWNILDTGISSLALKVNTNYYMKLIYDSFNYTLSISTDDKKYIDYITCENNTSTKIHQATIYIGVDGSTGTIYRPFQGSINLSPFATDVSGITITQWFEQFPVGAENTFQVKADLDLNLVSSDFFDNFASFVRKYVYPTLEAFEARLAFKNDLTFVPYVRQKMTYIASGNVNPMIQFITSEDEDFDVYRALAADWVPLMVEASSEPS